MTAQNNAPPGESRRGAQTAWKGGRRVQCTPPRRHPGCGGCCACLPLPLPTVPLPPPMPGWLQDADAFFRPLDIFAVDVIHNARLTATERTEAARAYFRRWGGAELRRALREADRVRALPPELVDVAEAVAA